MYYILLILFVFNVLIIYVDPIIDIKRKEKLKNKIHASKIFINDKSNHIEFETYPSKVLTNFKGENITIDVEYINIKEEAKCNCIVLKNVKKILSFNVKANSIVFQDSNYKEVNGIIYDDKNTACFSTKKMKIKELIALVQLSNINKVLLDILSNSTYFQFVPRKGLLRISAPYYEIDKKVRVVIPNQVDGINIETIEINCKNIDFIYIGKNVKRVVLEQDVFFNKVKIDSDNKYLKIRDNKLVYRVLNTFVHSYAKVLSVKDSTNFAYLPKISLSKNEKKCQKYTKEEII